MSEESWYASHDEQQIGPVAFDVLRSMAQSQTLGRDDLVWQIGSAGWIPASQVPELCDAAGWGAVQIPSLPAAPRASFEEQWQPHLKDLRHRVGQLDDTASALQALPHLRFVHRQLEAVGRQVTVHQLDLADRLMKRAGSLAYVLAATLFAAFFAIVSLRADSIQQLLATLLIVIPGASLCHFVAVHFLESGERMLRQTPTELSSRTLAMSLGILAAASGVLILVMSSHDLFRKVGVIEAILALPFGLLLLYAAAACLNPSSLNLSVESRADGAREAIGISMLLSKLLLRLIPVAFGLFSILAAGAAIYFCHQLAIGNEVELRVAQAHAVAPRALLVGLLPMGMYLVAVFAILLADFFRAPLDTADGVREVARALGSNPAADPGSVST